MWTCIGQNTELLCICTLKIDQSHLDVEIRMKIIIPKVGQYKQNKIKLQQQIKPKTTYRTCNPLTVMMIFTLKVIVV